MGGKMNRIVKIDSIHSGKVAFIFEDGQRLSFVFDFGTYTDNHFNYEVYEKEQRGEHCRWESTNVEVYGAEGEKINEYLIKEYGSAPACGVPVDDIPKIIKFVRNLEVENVAKD